MRDLSTDVLRLNKLSAFVHRIHPESMRLIEYLLDLKRQRTLIPTYPNIKPFSSLMLNPSLEICTDCEEKRVKSV